jgi:hypothetical protein
VEESASWLAVCISARRKGATVDKFLPAAAINYSHQQQGSIAQQLECSMTVHGSCAAAVQSGIALELASS